MSFICELIYYNVLVSIYKASEARKLSQQKLLVVMGHGLNHSLVVDNADVYLIEK